MKIEHILPSNVIGYIVKLLHRQLTIIMKKTYAILNFLSIVGIIIWNYYINAVGINGNTVGSLSDEYANLFTPASYAFSIWGLIFLGLIVLGIYQLFIAFSENENSEVITKMGPWLIIANLANASWLWMWLNEMTALSVGCMLIILSSLLMLVVKLDMENIVVPTAIRRWIWLPIALYAGWITVATIANVSAYLAKTNWTGGWTESGWAATMIIVAVLVNLLVLSTRRIATFAGVGVWALVAIAVRHWGTIPLLQWTALAGAILLLVAIIYNQFRKVSKVISSVEQIDDKRIMTA